MYAKRLNKVYPVNTPQEKKMYLDRGYDIYDDDGEIISHSPQRTVPYGEYVELKRKYEALRKDYEDLVNDLESDSLPPGSGGDIAPSADGEQINTNDLTVDPTVGTAAKGEDDEINTLHSPEDPAPKMGTGKKK